MGDKYQKQNTNLVLTKFYPVNKVLHRLLVNKGKKCLYYQQLYQTLVLCTTRGQVEFTTSILQNLHEV